METENYTAERRLEVFNAWMKNLSENQKVADIDPVILRGVLESCGANFEISEGARESLAGYSNKDKALGMNEVWGKEKRSIFKKWVVGEYIPYIEKSAARELHTQYDREKDTYNKIKYSGMLAFLGDLTALASGAMPMEKYRRITENRLKKGKVWQYGNREEKYVPSENASIPVDFPRKAIDRLSAAF